VNCFWGGGFCEYWSLCVGFVTVKAVSTPQQVSLEGLELTEDNVELVLDEVRPYLMSDGGNVALHEIDGLVVKLKLQGACGSCPSSLMTMKMGIERRLMEKIPEIMGVEQVMDEETGLALTEENVEAVSSSNSTLLMLAAFSLNPFGNSFCHWCSWLLFDWCVKRNWVLFWSVAGTFWN